MIAGEAGSGVFALNGPAARRCDIGDEIFILAYAYVTPEEMPLTPIVVDLKHPAVS